MAANQKTYIPRKGADAEFKNLSADHLFVNGNEVTGGVLLGGSDVIDLNGNADGLIMDAAQNVRLDGSSVGKLRGKISGTYIWETLAGIFRVLGSQVLQVDTINETTATAGVTIDGLLIKDGIVGTFPVITGDGAITIANSTVALTKGSAAAITLAAPTAGTDDGKTIEVYSETAFAHVITSSVDGFNAKGSSGTITLGGAKGDGVRLKARNGHWWVIEKINATVA